MSVEKRTNIKEDLHIETNNLDNDSIREMIRKAQEEMLEYDKKTGEDPVIVDVEDLDPLPEYEQVEPEVLGKDYVEVESEVLEPIRMDHNTSVMNRNREVNLIENDLAMEVKQDTNVTAVSKELFNSQDVDMKTDVSHDEINNIARLLFLEQRLGVRNISVVIDKFLRLRVSKNRKSRAEFIMALNNERKNEEGGFLTKLMGGGRGDEN